MQKQVAFAYTFLGYEQCRLNEKRQQQRRRCHRCVAAAAAPAAAEAAEINHGRLWVTTATRGCTCSEQRLVVISVCMQTAGRRQVSRL